MKTFVLLAVSIVLAGIFFCPMAMSAPVMPPDLQIVQPDPSLSKELSAFWGKWEGGPGTVLFFLIVEKIDEQKASLYLWRNPCGETTSCWIRYEAQVIKDGRKYKLQFRSRFANVELTLKGENLGYSGSDPVFEPDTRFRRVQ